MESVEPLPPRNDVLAIVSLVLGILAMLLGIAGLVFAFIGACCCLGQIGVLICGGLGLLMAFVGVILGIVSAVRISKRPDELTGRGIAIGGIVLNILAMLLDLAPIVLGILLMTVYAGSMGTMQMMEGLGYY